MKPIIMTVAKIGTLEPVRQGGVSPWFQPCAGTCHTHEEDCGDQAVCEHLNTAAAMPSWLSVAMPSMTMPMWEMDE